MMEGRALSKVAVIGVLAQVLVVSCANAEDDFADRLERVQSWEQSIEERQPPQVILDAAGVNPGMVVGEVGAGRGRYTVHLSSRVGSTGKVLANDIDSEALDFLQERCTRAGIANVETVLGDEDDPRFPEGELDMIFMVWVFHMVESPTPLLKSFAPSLKPGAKVVMIEPPPEEIQEERDGMVATDSEHVMPTVLTPESMKEISKEAGFRLVTVLDNLLEKDIIYILEPE